MAGRRVKQAYRMTARRKAALRKAQLASAKKRSRNKKIAIGATVGVVALAGTYWAGQKYGSGDIQKGLKSRKFSMTDIRNRTATRIAVDPKVKEQIMTKGAVSPPPKRWNKEDSAAVLSSDRFKTDPVKSSKNNVPQPKKSTPPKPDLAPDSNGNLDDKLNKHKNVPVAPGRPAVTQVLPSETASQGRQRMEDSPKIRKDGTEQQPKQDVWGRPGEFKAWSTTVIKNMCGGTVTEKNLKRVLGVLAKKEERLGRPLSTAQKNALWKHYRKVFNLGDE